MPRKNTQSMGEAINEYINSLKIKGKLNEVRLINSWGEMVGTTIAKATTNIFIRDKIMFVQIRSSVIKNELMNIKTEILERITKQHYGVITDIRFI
ncbi:MAG: DUF721 domain-containing protein [Bacteroidota bacterium]